VRLPRGSLDRATIAVDRRLQPLVKKAAQPRVKRVLRAVVIATGVAIVAVSSLGVVMLATMLKARYVAIGVLALGVSPVAADHIPYRVVRAVFVGLLVAVVAAVVAVMGLLGVDVIWARLRFERPDPEVGVAMAAVVVTAVTYAYLRWVGKPSPKHRERWALLSAASGLGLAWITREQAPELRLVAIGALVGVATWIYLWRAAGADIKRPLWWGLLMAGVLVVAPPLLVDAFDGKPGVVLLLVGALGAVIAGINGLWRPHATELQRQARWALGVGLVVGVAIPSVALAIALLAGGAEKSSPGQALPVAAAASPLPQRVLDHRPILLFDSGEEFRTPLDVDAMLKSGDVELCPKSSGLLGRCPRVSAVADLRGHFGNLRFDTQQIEDEHLQTTIYAHEVPDKLHPGWTDVDYWWYLPDNPARTGQGAMCGAGFVIPEITCFDHQSDWEGATVVLGPHDKPQTVRYAAHEHVINVPWPVLQRGMKLKALRPYADGRDVVHHPLVFVARGTHAGYPVPCRSSVCDTDKPFEDNSHDGRFEWPDGECAAAACVTAFPRSNTGGEASWNAFDGRWGSAHCIVKELYCARTNAPLSPGHQGRYNHPWCYDLAADTDVRSLHSVSARAPECVKH
jgi:hypothetical protein